MRPPTTPISPACLALIATLVGCQAELVGDLSPSDADAIVLALDSEGIAATRVADTSGGDARHRIEVRETDLVSALAVLRREGLPRGGDQGLSQLFEGGGLVPSVTEERARLAAATSAELARSLERIDGVLEARVHLALAEPSARALDAAPAAASASVLLRVRRGTPVNDDAVRTLVGGAVSGLDPAGVAVVRVDVEPARASAPTLAQVGPFAMAPSSEAPLIAAIATSLSLHLLAGVALVWSRRRSADRGARRTATEIASRTSPHGEGPRAQES